MNLQSINSCDQVIHIDFHSNSHHRPLPGPMVTTLSYSKSCYE